MYEQKKIKVFVINLRRSLERRKDVSKKLDDAGIEYEFFEGVDGTELNQDFLEKVHSHSLDEIRSYGRKMLPGEIGAAMSHLNVYRKIRSDKIDLALVLEDDIEFDKKLAKLINDKKNCEDALKNFELILLGYCVPDLNYKKAAECSFWGRTSVKSICRFGIPVKWYWAAIGYFIKYEAALKLLEGNEFPKVQADYLTANSPAYGIRLGVSMKPLIWPGKLNETSTIGERVSSYPDMKTISTGKVKSTINTVLRKINAHGSLLKFYNLIRKPYLKLKDQINLLQLKVSLKKYQFINKEPH